MARQSPIVLPESLTPKQVEILRSRSEFLLISGPAGTGKSFIALARGLRKLSEGDVERIIIIRSAVPTRDIGFLPGSGEEKIDPYADPYIPLIGQLSPRFGYREMTSKKLLTFASTSFLRGVTFDHAFVLVDEYQNMSAHELETVVTRVGEGTQMCVCGDGGQSDLQGKDAGQYLDVIQTLTRMDEFETFEFDVEDIVRSAFVRSYYEAKAATQIPPAHLWGRQA